jgi:hypothetical protein
MSNCCCLPGRAGGTPFWIRETREHLEDNTMQRQRVKHSRQLRLKD